MLSYPAIEEVSNDTTNHTQVLTAVKQNIEMMQGVRGGIIPCARVFITSARPGFGQSTIKLGQIKDGDLWIDLGNSNKLNFWDVTKKVWVPTT